MRQPTRLVATATSFMLSFIIGSLTAMQCINMFSIVAPAVVEIGHTVSEILLLLHFSAEI